MVCNNNMIANMLKCKRKLFPLILFWSITILTNVMSVKIVWGSQPHISSSQNSFLLPAINFEDKIHQYYSAIPDDSFARLYKTLTDKNREQIQFKNEREALAALLHDLNISKHSQVLVFSNTSLQLSKISAKSPRAIYFNDDLYVGYVPGGSLKLLA